MNAPQKAAAHLCIGLAAFFVVFVYQKSSGAGNSVGSSVAGKSDPVRQASARKDASRDTKRTMTSAEYQAAWDAIPSKRWGAGERMSCQTKLLSEWAEKDLEAALKAAFAESWSRSAYRTSSGTFTYQNAFAEVFVNRAEDVWKMIEQRKLGVLESTVLLEGWSSAVLDKDPDLFLSYLGGMDGGNFTKALDVAVRKEQDKDFLTKALDILAAKSEQGLAVDGLGRQIAFSAATLLSKDELMAKLGSSNEAMAGFYTSALATQFDSGSTGSSPEQITSAIEAIPAGQRGVFARALVNSPMQNPVVIQTSLNHLVSSGSWQLLDKQETSRAVQVLSRSADPVELAEWSASLPPRAETTEMFHRGVEPYIRKDREAAWDWIQQMEPGYWRDRALGEYSQVNLHVFKDPEKSNAAIGQIKDPAFREMVRSWRSGWEKQQGK